uniref:Uncharacterized protein MANES_06G084500 n=1 Tax=Rhizophora mucronata TaxID=61149 RepID=A0A2P2JMM7_RHIMU
MFNKKQGNFTSQESQNNKGRESHVEFEELSASEIKKEHQEESNNSYNTNEHQRVQKGTFDFIPEGV